MPDTPIIVDLICNHCGHPKARINRAGLHITARCESCHAYIKHLSKTEFKKLFATQETTMRTKIVHLVKQWCDKNDEPLYEGWKMLYLQFKKDLDIDLLAHAAFLRQGKNDKNARKITGMDAAQDIKLLDKLLQTAEKINQTTKIKQEPGRYSIELANRIHGKIPPEILTALSLQGWNVFGIYELVQNEINHFQFDQLTRLEKDPPKAKSVIAQGINLVTETIAETSQS